MEQLRNADPFLYHSIVREQRRLSLLELDEDEQADDEAVQNIEFDLREMDLPGGGTSRRSSLRGSLRGSCCIVETIISKRAVAPPVGAVAFKYLGST